MENKAHYALIGTFVLVTFAALVGFVAWLSNAQFDRQFDSYEVSFLGPVRGLTQGSEVRFNGLKVGEVSRLRWDEKNTNYVLVDIDIDPLTPVDTNSFAQLEPLGLTGLNYIQITPGGEEYPLIKNLPGPGPKRIDGRGTQLDGILDNSGSMIEAAQNALVRVNSVMDAEAIKDFHEILDNVNQITFNLRDLDVDEALVEETLRAFVTTAADVSAAALAVDKAAVEFDTLVQKDVREAIDRAKISMVELDKTLSAFGKTAGNTDFLITDARDAINRLSNSGLTDLEETVDGLRRVVLTFSRIADSLEQSPSQFIAGAERETVELPQ